MSTTPQSLHIRSGVQGIRNVSPQRSLYILPRDPVSADVLVPAAASANTIDCMFGFFGSGALRDIAPGLAEFLSRHEGTFRLLISPNLSEADRNAVEESVYSPTAVLEQRLLELTGSKTINEDALAKHTLECPAYLLSAGRLIIKVVYLPGGLFHDKVWLFREGGDCLAVSGSSNLTPAGLRLNHEQLRLDRSWGGGTEPPLSRRVGG